MHKFIFPIKDSFIWNHPSFKLKNFGRDEILEVESKQYVIKAFISASDTSTNSEYVGLQLYNFYGSLTGSLTGSGEVTGSLSGSGMVLPDEEGC